MCNMNAGNPSSRHTQNIWIMHIKMMPEFTLYAAFTNSIIAEIAVLNLVS